MKKITFLMILLLTGIVACKSTKNEASKPSQATTLTKIATNMTEVKWKQIAKGNNCGIETAKQVVIKNETDWKTAWKEAYSRQMPAPECPSIDFSTQYVIACYAGMGANAGYGIQIEKLVAADNKLTVNVVHSKPGKGCMSADMVVYPFIFISIENAQAYKETNFLVNKETKDCN